MATINPAQYFGFRNNGAISPGFIADLALYPDLTSWTPEKVWKNGRLVVDGTYQGLALDPDPALDAELLNSVKVKPLVLDSLKVPATGSKVRVIGLTYGQLLTESLALSWPATNGYYEAHIDLDIVKMVVWNRYDGDGRGQVGFLKGLKMTKGALAQTISHDSHQLVAAGTNDEDLLLAAQTVADLGGGLALALNGQVLGSLALPLGGLMSHVPARELARALDELDEKGRLCGFQKGLDPFLALGFMSLPVIPRLKLTERGLIEDFQVVDLVLA
jgi:adenine deaminase